MANRVLGMYHPAATHPSGLSAEMRFVSVCCIQARTVEQVASLIAAAAIVNWPRVAAISTRHRIDGLVYSALRECCIKPPGDYMALFARRARTVAFHGMTLAAETQHLCNLAEESGIPAVVLKGTPLALLAYGNVHTKHAKDIDLAVSPIDCERMRILLSRAGYRLMGVSHSKDEPWYHPDKRIQVELHTALVDHRSWLPGLTPGPGLARQWVGKGRGVPTLAYGDLFAYLCVHGSTHGWSRLKWLADLAGLVAHQTPDEIFSLYKHAREQGAEHQAAAALLLCSDLFGTQLRPDHEAVLRRGILVRWLINNALQSYVGRNETVEMDDMPLSTVRIHLGQIVLIKGWHERSRFFMEKIDRDRIYGGPGRWPIIIVRWISRRIKVSKYGRL